MQRAAMGRVNANGSFGARLKADKGTGFGAVAVQNLRLQRSDDSHELQPCYRIRCVGLTPDGDTMNSELEAGRNLLERRLRSLAPGQTIGDDADVMAAFSLALREIQHVTEDSAHWRAQGMQDAKRLIDSPRHVHNQRSPTPAMTGGMTELASRT